MYTIVHLSCFAHMRTPAIAVSSNYPKIRYEYGSKLFTVPCAFRRVNGREEIF
jgi:hypothetical protein